MAKILMIKEKKEEVEGRQRTVIKPKQYIVRNFEKDFETQYGTIKKEDLLKEGIVKSSTGKEYIVYEAGFIEEFKRLRKLPQTIPTKDIGMIITETGLNKDSIVLDAGTGSGHLACFLANICKHVYTYEIKDENIEISKENASRLGLKNITFNKGSIYDGVAEKNVDLFTLDVPNPAKALDSVLASLKVGGFVVVYSLCLQPLQEFMNAIKDKKEFSHIKTIEVLERLWKIEGEIARPKNIEIGHSGFLTFVKRIV